MAVGHLIMTSQIKNISSIAEHSLRLCTVPECDKSNFWGHKIVFHIEDFVFYQLARFKKECYGEDNLRFC